MKKEKKDEGGREMTRKIKQEKEKRERKWKARENR